MLLSVLAMLEGTSGSPSEGTRSQAHSRIGYECFDGALQHRRGCVLRGGGESIEVPTARGDEHGGARPRVAGLYVEHGRTADGERKRDATSVVSTSPHHSRRRWTITAGAVSGAAPDN